MSSDRFSYRSFDGPTLDEENIVKSFDLGYYRIVNNLPVLIVYKSVDSITDDQNIIFDMSSKFINDWRCPISDYGILKVVNGQNGDEVLL